MHVYVLIEWKSIGEHLTIAFSYNGFPELRSELFLKKQISNASLNEKPVKSIHEPLSRRTKQEIRSAQKVMIECLENCRKELKFHVMWGKYRKINFFFCWWSESVQNFWLFWTVKLIWFYFTDGSSICKWSTTMGKVRVLV